MNEPKTACATCGTSILKRTAEKNFGLCAPCYRRVRSRPPDTFEMPGELVRRIVSLDKDPEKFRQAAWREGPASVHGMLDRLEQIRADYLRWVPVLRAFAIECRQGAPVPRIESFDEAAQAQYRLLHNKMREFAESKDGRGTLHGDPHCVAVLSTNGIGLAAATELFGGSGAVILEELEQRYWFSEVYEEHQAPFGWYSFAWWTIRDGSDTEGAARIRDRRPTSPRYSLWVVESGVQWGPLAGGSTEELWLWDGSQAEFLEKYKDVTF
jgi:hypothetical protein